MAIDFLYPQYEVVRNNDRCINCRACERQCANEVHFWDADNNRMQADESKCVACHRCVALCPTRALKIVKTDHTFRENANWTGKAISEVYRQAGSGGVLLSSMGNPDPHPIYWDKILINASQVTNPSIDPLREPMETKTFLGKKPGKIERDENGNLVPNLAPQLEQAFILEFIVNFQHFCSFFLWITRKPSCTECFPLPHRSCRIWCTQSPDGPRSSPRSRWTSRAP